MVMMDGIARQRHADWEGHEYVIMNMKPDGQKWQKALGIEVMGGDLFRAKARKGLLILQLVDWVAKR